MSDERTPEEKPTRSAEVEKNAEANRQNPTEVPPTKQDVEYDELLDDRFQATDN